METNELASNLRVSVSRLLRVIKREVKQDKLLSLTERSTLGSILQHQNLLSSELASIEKVTSQSMSQIINKLYKNGLIKKVPSEKDKRKIFISVTPEGRELIESKRNKTSEWLAKTIAEKTTEEESRF